MYDKKIDISGRTTGKAKQNLRILLWVHKFKIRDYIYFFYNFFELFDNFESLCYHKCRIQE